MLACKMRTSHLAMLQAEIAVRTFDHHLGVSPSMAAFTFGRYIEGPIYLVQS
jgi:hypothetical protein